MFGVSLLQELLTKIFAQFLQSNAKMWPSPKKRPLSALLPPFVVFRVKLVCHILCFKKLLRRKTCNQVFCFALLIIGTIYIAIKLVDDANRILKRNRNHKITVDYYELFFVNNTNNDIERNVQDLSLTVSGINNLSRKVSLVYCPNISPYLRKWTYIFSLKLA